MRGFRRDRAQAAAYLGARWTQGLPHRFLFGFRKHDPPVAGREVLHRPGCRRRETSGASYPLCDRPLLQPSTTVCWDRSHRHFGQLSPTAEGRTLERTAKPSPQAPGALSHPAPHCARDGPGAQWQGSSPLLSGRESLSVAQQRGQRAALSDWHGSLAPGDSSLSRTALPV